MTTRLRLPCEHSASHWRAHARQWSLIGSPLRPHTDDIAIVRDWLDTTTAPGARGALLGVTPELAQATAHRAIVAIDRERAMIDLLQRAIPFESARAIQGDWLALPLAARSLAFALGDGSFNLLRYPRDYHALFGELRRVMCEDAALIVRVFARPDAEETCAAVLAAAFAGRIGNFHAFKWRFAMALVARNRHPDIGVADIHREFDAWVPDRDALALGAGWTRAAIDTIDVYRGSDAVYSFPTLEEWRVVAARHGRELACAHGRYELAERCPLLLHRMSA
jgi:SAM-dependent methyltransferase